MTAAKIRQQYRRIRRSLSPQQKTQNAILLNQNIQQFLSFKHALKIAAYIATNEEISLNPWIAATSRQQVYLPKLHENFEPRLRFARFDQQTLWKRIRYNILEPVGHWGQTLHPRRLDIILMPLVAFDRQGYRLGMGGGYYDRSLAFRCSRRQWLKPTLVGVAHSCQEHPSLPHEYWDVPLDYIITEQEIITPSLHE